MTKVDGFGNRYELVDPKTVSFQAPPGMVITRKNNEAKGVTGVSKSDWDRWEQVADSKVEQKEMF